MATRRKRSGLESTCWIVGWLLLTGSLGFGAVGALAGKMDLAEFERARAAAWQGFENERPDQALWSEQQVRAFNASLSVDVGPPLAVLRAPSLDLVVPIYKGSDDLSLSRGAGLVEGLPLPGKGGNLGISGHRDSYFRVLKDIKAGDPVFVDMITHVLEYRVEAIHIVDKADMSLLQETEDPTLSLVTCYPFYYIGNAPQRYIVRASFVGSAAVAPSTLEGVSRETE